MKKFLLILIMLMTINPAKSYADGLSLIRDFETENFLYDLTRPIFKAAGLNPNDIKIYIVNDSSVNAFVAGGQNVFINTGLITKYSDPNVLIGVIAHETGHITGGHLARSSEDMKGAENAMILSYVAGIAAAIAAKPDAGMAIIMGGTQIAQRTALKFTRTQEESADTLAIKYLSATHNSPEGLLKVLQDFNTEEKSYQGQIDEYALTHPISQKRINFIKANLKQFPENSENPILKKRLARIIAKLNSFLGSPDQVLRAYSGDNDNDKYARVVALFRLGRTAYSVKLLDELISKNPADGDLYDLKGQILAESGSAKKAIVAYNQAIKLNEKNDLARIALANLIVNLDSHDEELNNLAINHLLTALKAEKDDPSIYKILAKAYDHNYDTGKSYLALAQMSYLENNAAKTKKYIKMARENIDESDKASLLTLDDLEAFSKDMKDKKTSDNSI